MLSSEALPFTLRLLRAPAWQHHCFRPYRTPAPSPGRGSRRAHRPSEVHSAQMLMLPPSSEPADTVDPPPPSPWDAPPNGDYSTAAPPCAPCITCMLGLCAHHTGFAYGAVAALFVSPLPVVPSSMGGREGETALVAPARPLWGGGLFQLHLCGGCRSLHPLRAGPQGMGVGGRPTSPASVWGGGFRDPRGHGGGGSIGPYADCFPLSDPFQGGGGV